MTGVQLIGKKAVLTRYSKLNCESWALYQGKQFIVGGTGAEELEGWLDDFQQSGTTAIYTMRVYDFDEAPTSSAASADYVACIHFKVIDTYEGLGVSGYSNKLGEKITAIEERLKKMDEGRGEEPDEPGGIGSIVNDWLQNPDKLAVIFGIAKQIFTGGSAPVMVPTQPIQKMSGFNMQENISASSAEGLARISQALDILGECDPDLVRHLEQLAKLAKTEPAIFKAMIGKLDGL